MKKHFFRKDVFIFFIGLMLCSYPIVSNWIEHYEQINQITTYQQKAADLGKERITEILAQAKRWNEILFLNQKGFSAEKSGLQYDKILNLGNGIMGSIEIPVIDVNIPIYHGTSDEVLSIGAGHMKDTSLPVGGDNNYAVLTGHRGLPSSKLFTRLDELKINDLFYINVLNETMVYQIDTIRTVVPEEITSFDIEEGKDLVALITCTPYGINTHRLVLIGHRIPYEKETKEKLKKKALSAREFIFYSIPIVLSLLGILILKKRKEKCTIEK